MKILCTIQSCDGNDPWANVRRLLPVWCWRILAIPAALFALGCAGLVAAVAIAAPILLPFAVLIGIGMSSAIAHLAFPNHYA